MNDFFTNLVGRHLGTCDTIQPRTLGRFESERGEVAVASPDEGTNPAASESDQMLHPPDEASYEPPKETASEIHPLDSTVVNRGYPIDPRSEFSVETSNAILHESDHIGADKDYSSPSLLEQSDTSAQPGLTEQPAVLSESQIFPKIPYDTQPLDIDRYSHPEALQQEQPNKTALVDKHDTSSNEREQPGNNESHEVTRDNKHPTASRPSEHYLDNELNHRIRSMLRHLAADPKSPTTEHAREELGSQKVESQISTLSEKNTHLLDTDVASLEPAQTLEQQADNLDKISADDRKRNTDLFGRLEPPSWLPDLEAQFNQRLQQIETKADPVVNVTIGRVEVRAVQSETPKQARRQKKPTGVMSLDDYLKQRGRGGNA